MDRKVEKVLARLAGTRSPASKAPWIRPEVKKIRAGSAENAVGVSSDDGVNFS